MKLESKKQIENILHLLQPLRGIEDVRVLNGGHEFVITTAYAVDPKPFVTKVITAFVVSGFAGMKLHWEAANQLRVRIPVKVLLITRHESSVRVAIDLLKKTMPNRLFSVTYQSHFQEGDEDGFEVVMGILPIPLIKYLNMKNIDFYMFSFSKPVHADWRGKELTEDQVWSLEPVLEPVSIVTLPSSRFNEREAVIKKLLRLYETVRYPKARFNRYKFIAKAKELLKALWRIETGEKNED